MKVSTSIGTFEYTHRLVQVFPSYLSNIDSRFFFCILASYNKIDCVERDF